MDLHGNVPQVDAHGNLIILVRPDGRKVVRIDYKRTQKANRQAALGRDFLDSSHELGSVDANRRPTDRWPGNGCG